MTAVNRSPKAQSGHVTLQNAERAVPDPWIDLIRATFPEASCREPASPDALDAAESSLGTLLPDDLRALLRETNGATHSEHGYDLLWAVERIVRDNERARTDPAMKAYMPLDHILFFADAGNGDLFGFEVQRDGVVRDDVFSWNHEDDSRSWAAPDLATFLQWYSDGRVKT
jgi:hypothetical protein